MTQEILTALAIAMSGYLLGGVLAIAFSAVLPTVQVWMIWVFMISAAAIAVMLIT